MTSRLRWVLVLGALTASAGCGDTFGPDRYSTNEKAIKDFEVKGPYQDKVKRVVTESASAADAELDDKRKRGEYP